MALVKVSESIALAILNSIYIVFYPHTKFDENRMKNTEVEKIRYLSALVGRFGRSKNSRSDLKLLLFLA